MERKDSRTFKPMKLGKLAARKDSRTFKLAKYLGALPPIPDEVSWVVKVPRWPMYLNNELGDCVIAAMGHCINQWSYFATGTEVVPTDQDILTGYEQVGGYVPGDPSTDNGCDILTALKWWRKTGLAGHKIGAFASIDPTNDLEVRAAIQLFGNIYIGVQLPISAQTQTAWTVPDGGANGDGAPGSWGGHCVPVMADSPMSLTCVTWGQRLKMSHNFLKDYCDEAYVMLSPDWIERTGISPSTFDNAALRADLAAL